MKKSSLGLLLLSLVLGSCSKTVYLQNMIPEKPYEVSYHELRIRQGDRLSIVVNSNNPEMAAPFNIYSGVSYQVSGEGEIFTGQSGNTSVRQGGYCVDNHGMIDFPVLGRLKVEGLTSGELAERIKARLIADKYIDDPMVTVDFSDIRITVMGEVVKNGTVPLSGKGLNLLEALTLSGGLTGNADPGKVTVIRAQEGVRKMYETDIRSTEIFKSPCFALQQDDIVYVQPRSAKMTDREERGWRYYTLGSGLVGLAVSLMLLFK